VASGGQVITFAKSEEQDVPACGTGGSAAATGAVLSAAANIATVIAVCRTG